MNDKLVSNTLQEQTTIPCEHNSVGRNMHCYM